MAKVHGRSPDRNDIREALDAAGNPPSEGSGQAAKRRVPELLSHHLAKMFELDLRARFGVPSIKAGESKAGSASGAKKLDVNYSDDLHGLKLGISIKTIVQPDAKTGTYTKNRKRVDEEFLAEAMDYHVRQPYAVLIGLYFLPFDACDDGNSRRASSFGQWVEKLFRRTGRTDPKHQPELFERMFIGLFENTTDETRGEVRFFDVQTPPPKHGRPPQTQLITWAELIDKIYAEHRRREGPFLWAADDDGLSVTASDEDSADEETDSD